MATAVLAAAFITVGGLVAVASGWEPRDVMPHHTGSATPTTSVTTTAGRGTRLTGAAAPAPTTRALPAAARPGAVSRPGTASPVGRVDLASPSVVVEGPLATAQALADARAALWGSGDLAHLDTVDAPGSAAWSDDAHRVGEARAGGWRYEGVRFTVRSATAIAHTPTTASIRIVLDSAAYAVVGPDGREQRAAVTGRSLVLDLALTKAGWRVSRVNT